MLGKAVQQQDRWPIVRPTRTYVEVEAVGAHRHAHHNVIPTHPRVTGLARPGRGARTYGLADGVRGDRVGDGATEAPVTLGVELARVPEVTAIEVRPERVEEDHLGVGRL